MLRIIGIIIAVLLIVVVAYPFAEDLYQRYTVAQRLKSIMTPQEQAEFDNWNGDAASFAQRLYRRCELTQGPNAVACDRYKSPMEPR